jgi:hypothetical protein
LRKVNRCLTEGRRAFVARVEGIESGAECERLAPLLSALADGEATADDMAALRPHLRGCSACRATLRDYRAAPREVAGLAAPVAAGGLLAWLGERVASWWAQLRAVAEAAAANKAAAVAASSVAIAGGGAATVAEVDRSPVRAPERATAVAPRSAPPTAPAATTPVRYSTGSPQAAGGHAATRKRSKRRAPNVRAGKPKAKPTAKSTAQAPAPATAAPQQGVGKPTRAAPPPSPPDETTGEFGP